ncbi:MAG: glycosyltransferase [Pseudomonadota bacterium]
MITAVTICALLALALPFVAYPLLLWFRAVAAPRPVDGRDWTPSVDLIICAHNEEDAIEARLENALALDYPRDQLRIRVASDGSDDGTGQLVRSFATRGVEFLDLPRVGKAAALNAAVEAGDGEILAFSDANSEWEPQALRSLLWALGDPQVGGAAGDQRYRNTGADSSGERSYWSFDRLLKQWQSRAGNVTSATGAIYAIRRSLFEPAPADATDDFMISTAVIARGFRLVFVDSARAWELPASGGREFRRKLRVITRGLRAVQRRRALLNPLRYGTYAVQLLLHKLLRRLVWVPLTVLLLITPLYLGRGPVEFVSAVLLFAFLFLGGVALAIPRFQRIAPLSIAAYVLMVNAACALATLRLLRGERVDTWATEREAQARAGS